MHFISLLHFTHFLPPPTRSLDRNSDPDPWMITATIFSGVSAGLAGRSTVEDGQLLVRQ